MDVAALANLLLFMGAFGASLMTGDDSPSAAAEEDEGLYDAANYSRTDRLGAEDDVITADADSLAWFMDAGDDQLTGSSGADYANLGAGNDAATMGAGNDIIEAALGNDTVSGGNGNDIALGGEGEDNIFGDLGDDSLGGDAGNDRLEGGTGTDILSGGLGDDLISGFTDQGGATAQMNAADGRDQLFGGAGDDRLLLGRGDSATGGAGADSFEMDARWRDGTDAFVIADYQPGTDSLVLHHTLTYDPNTSLPITPTLTVESTPDGLSSQIMLNGTVVAVVEGVPDLDPAAISLQADASVDAGYRAENFDTTLPGTSAGDTSSGTSDEDYGRFGAGADSISGGAGNDSLLGEDGTDSLTGDLGNDTLSGGEGNDALNGGLGDDHLRGDLGDDIALGGAGSDQLYGGAGGDTLSGNSAEGAGGTASSIDGIDRLYGGDGDDVLILGKGDLGFGGAGADLFTLDGAANTEAANFATINDYDATNDRIELEYTPVLDRNGVEIPPTLSVIMGPNDAYAVIMFNGDALAHVTGATNLTTADVRLVRAG